MTQERMSSAAFRASQGLPPPGTVAGVVQVSKVKPQIRIPQRRKANKTELACAELLKRLYPAATIMYEPWSFKLPSGTSYKADWVVIQGNVILEVTECKGPHIHSSASIRAFKEARATFPSFNFVFRQKRGGEWTSSEEEPTP